MSRLGFLTLLLVLIPAAPSVGQGPGSRVPEVTHLTSSIDAQSEPATVAPRSRGDSYWYGRFGYGTIAGEARYGGPGLGFGRRIERNRLALDVLFFSGQVKLFGTSPDLHTIGGTYTHAHSLSLMTLKGLYLVRPRSRTTPYVGGGAGWRSVSFWRSVVSAFDGGPSGGIYEEWRGSGLEGQFTVGYSLARADTSTRLFVQADVSRPFSRTTRYSRTGEVVGDRYVPSLAVSLGVGW